MNTYRPPSLLPRFGAALILAALLTGCIVVQRFGVYWDRGYDDPCIQQIVEATMLEGNPQGVPVKQLARSLKLGGHRFVMLRDKPGEEGGNLYRYTVINGEYTAYRLNEQMREQFLRDHPGIKTVVLTDETVTIPELNEESMRLLISISDNPAYWIAADHHRYNPGARKDCVEK